MQLNQVDLNLFIVFDAIYSERNLTRAADLLCITQPAVSNALNRLRNTLDDPLFVRSPNGMMPTPVADNIISQVREALKLLNSSVQESTRFDPSTSDRIFTFCMNDETEALMLPALLEYLQQVAPGIAITSYYVRRDDIPKELASGQLDFAIDVPLFTSPDLRHQELSGSDYVCLVRHDHPAADGTFTLDDYLALDHINISSRRTGPGYIDFALTKLGKQRKVRLRARHYLVAPRIVEQTDMALTVPRSVAMGDNLRELELPFNVPDLSWHLYWHKSADQDQANTWMRQVLTKLGKRQ